MRPWRGLLLFLVIAAPVFLWNEAFPTAQGQREAELRLSPFASMRLPEGVRLSGSVYEPARFVDVSAFPFGGSERQLVCARLRQTFEFAGADALRGAFVETALAAGKSRDDAETVMRGQGALLYVGTTAIGFDGGEGRAVIRIVDLPEPLGGRCSGGRIGIYPTRVHL